MTSISITIPGEPQGKARPRFAAMHSGKRVTYKDAKTKAYEGAIQYAATSAMRGRGLLQGPVSISIVASFSVPKSWPKCRQKDALAGRLLPTVKPDFDNIGKAVTDPLNGIVFKDDSQIAFAMVSKRYDAEPSVRVEIAEIMTLAAPSEMGGAA